MEPHDTDQAGGDIAIIGMAGRFPGAYNLTEFQRNLMEGVCSIQHFSREEMLADQVPAHHLNHPDHVPYGAIMADLDKFDAGFFGFSPRDAALLPPQYRVFMELAWAALEDAGHDVTRANNLIGLYAGAGFDSYFLGNIHPNRERLRRQGVRGLVGMEKDYLATGTAYKLGLKGPAMAVQTYCSSSLVAVHLACQSLLGFECDLALAGGVNAKTPQKSGWLFQEGGIRSPDGRCRAFDANAAGTVFGNGAGVVVLKRLADALADHDHITAVIKATGVNNDGGLKVAYTAPSVEGQAEVIAETLAAADVDADTIGYVEAHGTGTAIGDPVEVAALTKAFRLTTDKRGFCAMGSLKTNIGHLEAAAGIAGLIKTALALKQRRLPPSLGFETANPQIDFPSSPFFVNTEAREWQPINGYRRAGVSSFGVGGTNAHAVLEEAPAPLSTDKGRSWLMLPLSAKSEAANARQLTDLETWLHNNPHTNLADAAFTLQTGRAEFNHRFVLLCNDRVNALAALKTKDPNYIFRAHCQDRDPAVIFMFPGQGSLYAGALAGLYQSEPVYRRCLDECAAILRPVLGVDPLTLLFPDSTQPDDAVEQLQSTAIAQPLLFICCYAMAQQWLAWGIKPRALLGHSVGEFVAACLARVFSLKDALTIISARGRLMGACPMGAMLAVRLSEAELTPYLTDELNLAVVNGPRQCVVSGLDGPIKTLTERLKAEGVTHTRLIVKHPFHSPHMEPAVSALRGELRAIQLNPPRIPIISCLTGMALTNETAMNRDYWARHAIETVHFDSALQKLFDDPRQVILEVGPGQTLTHLAAAHPQKPQQTMVLGGFPKTSGDNTDTHQLISTLAQLWLEGLTPDWSAFYQDETRARIPLPTYPFERERHWIDPPTEDTTTVRPATQGTDRLADLLFLPAWRQAPLPPDRREKGSPKTWLLFVNEQEWQAVIERQLQPRAERVITVAMGDCFQQYGADHFSMDHRNPDDFTRLLIKIDKPVRGAVFAWPITCTSTQTRDVDNALSLLSKTYWSLMYLARALGMEDVTLKRDIVVLTHRQQTVLGDEKPNPACAAMLAAMKVVGREYAHIRTRSIDLDGGPRDLPPLMEPYYQPEVAYRFRRRYLPKLEAYPLPKPERSPFRQGGVYLITGGMSPFGAALAAHLHHTVGAKSILVGMPGQEERRTWEQETAQSITSLVLKGEAIQVRQTALDDKDQTKALAREIAERYGKLDGIIHAWGVKDGRPIHFQNAPNENALLVPKLKALMNLSRAFTPLKPAFLVYCGAAATHHGSFGQADHGAFDAYQQAIITADGFWENTKQYHLALCGGRGGATPRNRQPNRNWWETKSEDGISETEAVLAIERLLTADQPNLIIAPPGLRERIAESTNDPFQNRNEEQHKTEPTSPDMAVDPEAQMQKEMKGLWATFLGLGKLDPDTSFFELGGDSLTAVNLAAQISDHFQIQVRPIDLLHHPTINKLTAHLNPMPVRTTPSE